MSAGFVERQRRSHDDPRRDQTAQASTPGRDREGVFRCVRQGSKHMLRVRVRVAVEVRGLLKRGRPNDAQH